MLKFLFLLTAVGFASTQYLHLHKNLKRSKRPGPVKLTANTIQNATSHRSKRSWGDETHDSTNPNDISVTVFKLARDSHNIAYVEWGGTTKNSETILVLTRDSKSPPTWDDFWAPLLNTFTYLQSFSESTLYVSTDYGKSFETKKLTYGGKPVICDFIYQSTVDHKLVSPVILTI